MITSAQIRAARALIKWTGAELSKKSGVAFSTVMRLEAGEGVPGAQAKTLNASTRHSKLPALNLLAPPNRAQGCAGKKNNSALSFPLEIIPVVLHMGSWPPKKKSVSK